MSKPHDGVFKRCGCRNPKTGRRCGARCPQLGMRGHGAWYFRLEVPRGRDGKRRQLRRGGFPSRHAAWQAREFLLHPTGLNRNSDVVTVGQWLRLWLDNHQCLATSTLRSYSLHIRRYLHPGLGRLPLHTLNTDQIQAVFTAIIRRHAAWGTPLSPATLRRIQATLRAALNAAVRRGFLTTNPARFLELPPGSRPHPVVWTPARIAHWEATGIRPAVAVWTAEHTATFLTWLRDQHHPLHPLFHLMALLGLRRGETLGLRWYDLDLRTGTLTVTQQVRQHGRHLDIGATKSRASNRILTLDHGTLTLLRQLRAAWSAAHPDQTEPIGYVFPGDDGGPLRPDTISALFRKLNDASGLPPVRLHDLRHGAASLSLAAGNDLRTVQALLGHASITLTADTYTSILPNLAHHAAEATAQLITNARRTTPTRRNLPRRACPSAPARHRKPPHAA